MTRHVLTACALVSVLFGIGYVVRGCWFRPESAVQARTAEAPTMPSAKTPLASAPRAIVKALSGIVELRSAARGWQPLAADQELRGNDAVRTTRGARAQVAMGSEVRIELDEQSELSLPDAVEADSRLRLESGRIGAHVRGSAGAALKVEVRGNDAVAQTREGDFLMLRRADGQVTVATTRGSVDLRARDHAVRVDAGQQSLVPVDHAPSAPKPIPPSLFLKVVRVGATQTNKRETELGGSTTPGANVTINGLPVSADGEGKFTARVPLREGNNSVIVTAQDALGRTKHQTLAPIHVDTQAPKLGGEVRW